MQTTQNDLLSSDTTVTNSVPEAARSNPDRKTRSVTILSRRMIVVWLRVMENAKRKWQWYTDTGNITITTHKARFALYGMTRHDRIFFYCFHMLEFTPIRHRQPTKNTVSLELTEENILLVCACHCMSCLLTDGRLNARWFLSCRVVPHKGRFTLYGTTRQKLVCIHIYFQFTDKQNILISIPKTVSLSLAVDDGLVWIRARENHKRIFCRVVTCRIMWIDRKPNGHITFRAPFDLN
jgi:hypothetical protein